MNEVEVAPAEARVVNELGSAVVLPNRNILGMIAAFMRLNYRVYEGTVSEKVALRRLKAFKAQKRARRASR